MKISSKKHKKRLLNRYKEHIPTILLTFSNFTRLSITLSQLFATSDLFLDILGHWLHSGLQQLFDVSIFKNLLALTQDLFNKLSNDIKKKFTVRLLPVLDQVLSHNPKKMIRVQIQNYLLKKMYLHAEPDTLQDLSEGTKKVIQGFNGKNDRDD